MLASHDALATALRWCRYPGATNTENDIAIISKHLSLLADDVGNTIADATTLPELPTSFRGLISFGGDTDVVSFQANNGTRLTVVISLVSPYFADITQQLGKGEARSNLDAELTLMDSAGDVLKAWSNDVNLLSGEFNSDVLPVTVSMQAAPAEVVLSNACTKNVHR